MARINIPTMRVKVDANPKGSATTHVTMPGDNPFERGVTHLRSANQPSVRAMLPGMGHVDGWFDDFASGFSGKPGPGTTAKASDGATAGGADSSKSATSNGWGNIIGKIADTGLNIGTQYLQADIAKKIAKAQTTHYLPTPAPAPAPVPQPTRLPGQTSPQPIVITTPAQAVPPAPTPQSQSSGMAKAIPWVIGGVGLLVVTGMFMMRRSKKSQSK